MGVFVVTGGTGFLGSHVVAELTQAGHMVRLLNSYSAKATDGGPVEVFKGDILSKESLKSAFEGADGVYHLTNLIEHSRCGLKEEMFRVNVEGTINILRAARDAGIRRVVYASTAGVVSPSMSERYVADDSSPYAEAVTKDWPYYQSKIEAEKSALEWAFRNQLELVIMRPTLLLGPGDRRLSSCRSMLDLLDRKVPYLPGGGLSFVDVRDVARTFVVAMARGHPGKTYLLSAVNLSMREYFLAVEAASGVPTPKTEVPTTAAWVTATAVHGMRHLLGRWDPSLDPVVVEMAQHFWYCNPKAAKADLGFQPRDPMVTIKETVQWLETHREGLRYDEGPRKPFSKVKELVERVVH